VAEISRIIIEKTGEGYIELTQANWGNDDAIISFPIHQWKLIKWLIEEEIKRPVE
jgi:hypothetical protein